MTVSQEKSDLQALTRLWPESFIGAPGPSQGECLQRKQWLTKLLSKVKRILMSLGLALNSIFRLFWHTDGYALSHRRPSLENKFVVKGKVYERSVGILLLVREHWGAMWCVETINLICNQDT